MTDEVEQVAAQEELVSQETQSPETVDTETVSPPSAVDVQKAELEERLRLVDEQARRQQSNFNRKEAQILAENDALRAKLRENLPPEDLVTDYQAEVVKLKAEKQVEADIKQVAQEFNIDQNWLKDQNPTSYQELRRIASHGIELRRLAEERGKMQKLQAEIETIKKEAREAARQEVLKVRKEIGVDTVANTGPVSPSKSIVDRYLKDEMTDVEKEDFKIRMAKGEFNKELFTARSR